MTFRSFVRRCFSVESLTLLGFTVLSFLLLMQLFSCLFITGHSMDPSLADGQFLVGVNAANTHLFQISRGDIVIADCPQLELTIVKRVVGLPGDRLQLVQGRLYLNGQLYHEPYIYEPMQDEELNNCAEFTVPQGHYFLMGDNRNNSLDSRRLGFFRRDQLLQLVYPKHQPQLTAIVLGCIVSVSFLSIFLAERLSRWLCRRFPALQNKEEFPQAAENQANSLIQTDEAIIYYTA